MAKLGVNTAFARMHAESHPPYVSVPWCAFAASQTALHGVLAALLDRERTGAGQRVEANLVQGYATLDTWSGSSASSPSDGRRVHRRRHVRRQRRSQQPAHLHAPRGADEGRAVAPIRPGGTAPVPRVHAGARPRVDAERSRMEGLPAFEDADRRLALWTRMLQAAGSKTMAEWEEVFDADPDVFAELFRSGAEVLDHPQLVADGHVVEVVDPERGPVRQPGPLVRCTRRRPARRGRPPPWGVPRVGTPRPRGAGAAGAAGGRAAARRGDRPRAGDDVAAPYGATLLTDLGARVIKVEALAGDRIRTILPFPSRAGPR